MSNLINVAPTAESLWNNIKARVKILAKYDICLNEDKHDIFVKFIENEYKDIQNEYMHKHNGFLDRHKVAAIIIVAILKNDIIFSKRSLSRGKIFLGSEIIATEVAFEWMLQQFNNRLKENNIDAINKYVMPEAFACETSYFDIFCRGLYYSKERKTLSTIDIAERLFLIEYITILKENISPAALKE